MLIYYYYLFFLSSVLWRFVLEKKKKKKKNATIGDLKSNNPTMQIYSIPDGASISSRLRVTSQWADQGGVLFLGYEQYVGISKKQKGIRNWAGLLICDEGHRIKSTESNTAVELSKIKTKRRIILTGTPLQNNLMEYWAMIQFVRPGMISRSHFDQYFKSPIEAGQSSLASNSAISLMRERSYVLSRTLAPCVLRKDQTILHASLPRKSEFIVYCPMTNFQRSLYYTYKDSYADNEKRKTLLAYVCGINKIGAHPDLLKQFLERRADKDSGWAKIVLDVFNTPAYKPEMITESPKLLVLLYLYVDCMTKNKKMLIFSQYIETLDYIERVLKKTEQGKRAALFRLHGSCSGSDREHSMKSFQNIKNAPAVFLISTLAGGVGINLNTAHSAVLFDVSFNPANDQQAIFRCYRYGLEHPVEIYRLVSEGTPESAMYARCISKEWMSRKVVDEQIPTREFMNTVDLRVVFTNECEADDNDKSKQKWKLEKEYCLNTSTALRTAITKLEERGHVVHKLHRHESLLIDDEDEEAGEREKSALMKYENRTGQKRRKAGSESSSSDLSDDAQLRLAIHRSLLIPDNSPASQDPPTSGANQAMQQFASTGPDLECLLHQSASNVIEIDEASTIVDSDSGDNIMAADWKTEKQKKEVKPDGDSEEEDSELELAIQESLLTSRGFSSDLEQALKESRSCINQACTSDYKPALSLSRGADENRSTKLPAGTPALSGQPTLAASLKTESSSGKQIQRPDYDLLCALQDADMQPESFDVVPTEIEDDHWEDISSEVGNVSAKDQLKYRIPDVGTVEPDEEPEYWMSSVVCANNSKEHTDLSNYQTTPDTIDDKLVKFDSMQSIASDHSEEEQYSVKKKRSNEGLIENVKRHREDSNDSLDSLLNFSSEEGTPQAVAVEHGLTGGQTHFRNQCYRV